MGEHDKKERENGRGRPKKDGEKVKTKRVVVRMTNDDFNRLNEISKWAKMGRSETIRALILEAKNYYIPDVKN